MKKTIQAVSVDKESIKLDNEWYNIANKVLQFIDLPKLKTKVGQTVECTVDDSSHTVTFLKVMNGGKTDSGKKAINEIDLGMCYKIAMHRHKEIDDAVHHTRVYYRLLQQIREELKNGQFS